MKFYVCKTKDNEVYLLTSRELAFKMDNGKSPLIIGTVYKNNDSIKNELENIDNLDDNEIEQENN